MIAQLNGIAQIWWQWTAGMFWQVSLFIILITLIDIGIRRWAWPQIRYVLWILVFLKLIIPPAWQMPISVVSWIKPLVEKHISIQTETRDMIAVSSQPRGSGMHSQNKGMETAWSGKATWQVYVFLAWIGGMIIFSILLIRRISRLCKLPETQDDFTIPEWFNELLKNTGMRMNLNRIPEIVFSKDAVSPAVYGLFRPMLLLPGGYLNDLSGEQAEHVLIHELCHLKRGDLWIHWFCLIIQIFYWFNPLLIWTRRQMKHVCEICCDLSVADILRGKTAAYRETLLNAARKLLSETVEPGIGLIGIFEEPFRIVARLRWLEKKTWKNRKLKIAATIFTSLAIILCVMPMAGLSKSPMQKKLLPARSVADRTDLNSRQIRDEQATSSPMIVLEILAVEMNKASDFDFDAEWELPGNRTAEGSPLIGLFRNGIAIRGKNFPDSETALKAMSPRGVAMRKIAVPENKATTVKLSVPFRQQEHVLEIIPELLENGFIRQKITLWTSHPMDKASTGVIRTAAGNGKTPVININKDVREGNTLVIGGLAVDYAMSEEDPPGGTYLYLLLTPRISQTYGEASEYFKATENEPAGDGSVQRQVVQVSDNPVSGKYISFNMRNIDIKELSRIITDVTGKKFIIDRNVAGKVSINIQERIPIDKAYGLFESVLEINGYAAVPSGENIRILKK